jgi:hypothetical protein
MHSLKSNRGSVLLTALIFAAVLAISVTSYIKISLNAAQLANRAFHLNAAQNLVDGAIERILWTLNNENNYTVPANWTTYGGFTARAGFPNEYQAIFPSNSTYYELSGGAKGQVKVWVGDYNSITQVWHAVAQATITLGNGSTLSKFCECYLQQRSYSDRGMIARNGISFVGNVKIDSWISRPTISDDIPYSTVEPIRRAEAQIASPNLIAIQNADVYGYVAIGTSTVIPEGITVGASGRVRGAFSGAGSGAGIDLSRVTCDFTASFPDVKTPDTVGATPLGYITSSTSLGNGTYTASDIALGSGSSNITVAASSKATLVVSGNMTLAGGARLEIPPGSSLLLYVGRDIAMTGTSGVQNGTGSVPNNADSFTLLGLRTAQQVSDSGGIMQNWDIQGTSYLSCVVFGPNADIEVNGAGDYYGSIVGNDVDMVGGGDFHQDESLASKRISGLWKLLKWRELTTPSQRSVYSAHLTF